MNPVNYIAGDIMKYIEQMKDTEIVWHNSNAKPIIKGNVNLIVYSQNEYGSASYLAGASLVKGTETHIASIYSKLMSVSAIGTIPDPIWHEWRLYQRKVGNDTVLILRISNSFPIEPTLDEGMNRNAWLYTYPTIRDVVLSLKEYGIQEMLFMTTDTLERYSSRTDVLRNGEYIEYEWNSSEMYKIATDAQKKEMEEDIFLVPISWVFAQMFDAFTNGLSKILICQGADCPVDEVSADTMLSRVKEIYGLDYVEQEYIRIRDLLLSAQNLQGMIGEWE